MTLLAFDIGGANLKVSEGRHFHRSQPFPLWRRPDDLPQALSALAAEGPPADHWLATMTGELADCYSTKAEGVAAIVGALARAAEGREVSIYSTDGRFVSAAKAVDQPLKVAAANWRALATFAGRYIDGKIGLLIDIGSTTTDVIPLVDGRVAAQGLTDPDRLVSGELVYSGVERTPLCALAGEIPWAGKMCPIAREVFATAWDVYLLLEDSPEEPTSLHTADCRPATRAAAYDRLARQICADRTMFSYDDALAGARIIAQRQQDEIVLAIRKVIQRLPGPPASVILSGQGEFLARRVIDQLGLSAGIVSLTEQLGPAASAVAPAYALAHLHSEEGRR